MTTLAVPRSRWTPATAVYHAPVNTVLYDCHSGGKIQGYLIRSRPVSPSPQYRQHLSFRPTTPLMAQHSAER